jgi:hypothetical protein
MCWCQAGRQRINSKNYKNAAGSGCWAYAPDLEETNGQSNSIISQDTRDLISMVLDVGWNTVPYSLPGWVNERFRSPETGLLPDWVIKWVKWWLSQYNTDGTERNSLDIPTGIDPADVLVAKTGSQMPNVYGSIYNSKFVDSDRALVWPLPGWKG